MSFVFSAAIPYPTSETLSVLACATIGGMLVFLGLCMEKLAELMNSRFMAPPAEPHKVLESWGWIVLMIGILAEVVLGWTAAIGEWQTRQLAISNDPLNQIVSDVSASARITIQGALSTAMPYPGSQPSSLMEMLETNALDYPHSLYLGEFQALIVDDVETWTRTGQFIPPSRIYVLKFHVNTFMEPSAPFRLGNGGGKLTVNDLREKIKALRISLNFEPKDANLPKDAEVIEGSAEILINGSYRKQFTIYSQKSDKALSESNSGNKGFWLYATNSIP